MKTLTVVPLTLKEANAHITAWHRHHKPAVGCRFCIGVLDSSGALRGVAVVGRPVARMLDDGVTAEVVRVATDGYPNACSALYGAARRIAREMGFRRLLTYTLSSEPGTSLKAAGWRNVGAAGGGSWHRSTRPRLDAAPTCEKTRWQAEL